MRIVAAPLIILVATSLAGCFGTTPTLPKVEEKIVTKVEYVVKIPPKELMTLPAKPASIDTSTATQRDVAAWIISNEEYINTLVNQFIGVSKFLVDEQSKADEKAKQENAVNMVLPPLKPITFQPK